MQMYFSWYFLLLSALSIFYGYTQCCSLTAMGATVRRARINWMAVTLSGGILTIVWSVTGFPLPIFYILAYFVRAWRLVGSGQSHRKDLFLLNLSYINSLVLHLAVISITALLQGLSMHTIMSSGFWRTMSVATVLTADIIEDLIFLRWPNLPSALSAEADSAEAQPFMAFLWFCTGYLLADSILCVVDLESIFPSLFLIGSITILMYFVIRFLIHINTIIRDEYLKDEHDRLSLRLEAVQKHAGTLKQIVDRDALTGAFSRRYVMERMHEFVESGMPFCLVFLDLDGLKRINDCEGHEAGDQYLIGFTQAMEVRIREIDVLARMGGDEFVVLMPNCDEEMAKQRIGGIRGVLENRTRGGIIYRFSYGVAGFVAGKGSVETLLLNADQAMYQDKERRQRKGTD